MPIERLARHFPEPSKLVVAILVRDEPALADTGTLDDPVYHVSDNPQLPVSLADAQLPYVRVLTLRGTRDEITDSAFVDIEIWADADTDDGQNLAELIVDKHIKKRKSAEGYGVLDTVRISIRPQSVPWGDINVSRHLAQVQVSARRTGG